MSAFNRRDETDAAPSARPPRHLESLGRLALGVAHDFNSILAVIATHAEMIVADAETTQSREHAVEICAAVQRAASLTRQLVATTRPEPSSPVPIDVNGVIERTIAMLARLLGADVAVSADLDPRIGAVVAEPGHIEQIVLDLVLNARDAIDGHANHTARAPEGRPGAGSIRVRTSELDLATDKHGSHGAIERGRWVVITVSDSSAGIDQATVARIFDPFVTTRADGSGLGLTTVDGIVKACGGRIDVRTTRGVGTSFAVHLPRAHDVDAAAPRRSASIPPAAGGSERILLVDDDDAVRGILVTVLERSGYAVVAAATPEAAVAACIGAPEPFDLLIADVVMPGMRCTEMITRIKAVFPELRVLMMSGHPERAQSLRNEGAALLEKPFSVDALLHGARDVLDGSSRRQDAALLASPSK